jgi:hypothetical protein
LNPAKDDSNQQMSRKNREFTWENLAKSEIFGYIQSRMYIGSWDLGKIAQDFTYRSIVGSWAKTIKMPNAKIDLFNSSSYANAWLLERLSRSSSSLNWHRKKMKVKI